MIANDVGLVAGGARVLAVLSLGLGLACGDDATVTTTFDPSVGGTSDETDDSGSATLTTGVSASASATVSGSSTGEPGSSSGPDTSTGPDTTTGETDTSSTGATDTTDTTGPIEDCGNEVVDAGEDCDGAELGGQDCALLGHVAGQLACTRECTFDESGCVEQLCGNETIEGSEACDGDELDGEDCTTQGADAGELACDPVNCVFDTSGCIMFGCGNGMQEGNETCDGADLDGQTCASQGQDGGTLACAGNCMAFDTAGCYDCGDNVAEGPEVCDGSDLELQTCASQGQDGGTLACLASCSGFDLSGCHDCGDGVAEGPEVCDGADVNGDDCFAHGFIGGGALGCNASCNAVTTGACDDTVCTTPNLAIGPGAGAVSVDAITIPATVGFVGDVNVSVTANHTWIGDLDVDVRHVDTDTGVVLLANPCGNFDNVDAIFDQDAAGLPACASPLGGGGNVRPVGDLENFTGMGGAGGSWELTIVDEVDDDGGTLTEWCLTIATTGSNPAACGDGHRQFTELCDGSDFGGETCASLGIGLGALACTAGCTIDTAGCVPAEFLQNDSGDCGFDEIGCSDVGGTIGNPQDDVECYVSNLVPPIEIAEVEYFLGTSVPLPAALDLVVFAWSGPGFTPGALLGSVALPALDIVAGQHTFTLPAPIASPAAGFCVGFRGTAVNDGFRVAVSSAANSGESYITASACGLAAPAELSTIGVPGSFCIRPTVTED